MSNACTLGEVHTVLIPDSAIDPSTRNWLRDYSQAVDIASLKKLQLQVLINVTPVSDGI